MINTSDLRKALSIRLNERNLSILVHSLFSSWMLAFLFEGQILYSLTNFYDLASDVLVFGGIVAIFTGLLLCCFFIKTKKAARRLFLCSYPIFIAVSFLFFFPPSGFWSLAVIISSLLAGSCVAAWGFYLKSGTPPNERMKTVADMLICSNILMILLNLVVIHLSPYVGLALSMIMLLGAFFLALRLPVDNGLISSALSEQKKNSTSIAGPLALLYLFIMILTVNSGLMYEVVNPSFVHLEWLTSWYWAIPYIVAIFIMRNLPRKTNRSYILYAAIAMIGLSFIGFMSIDRSATSYLIVNTLMLGACGVYDLFWWSILGELLEFHKNPAKTLGIGLSANVLGVLFGGLLGNAIIFADIQSPNSTLLALAVVCVAFALLPPLHNYLSSLLKEHAYLTVFSEISPQERKSQFESTKGFEKLSERERQVASLLLQGKTYRMIAAELFISENTVKYYVKNIYAKFNIQSRAELIYIVMKRELIHN